MKSILYLLSFILSSMNLLNGQTLRDSLEKKMSQQYRIKILAMSPKGNWVITGKHYDLNRDTVEIISTKIKNDIPKVITKISDIPFFLREEAVLTFFENKVTLHGLDYNNLKNFDNVKRIFPSPDTGMFALLDSNNKLSKYDIKGNQSYEIDSIISVEKNLSNKIFAVTKANKKFEIFDISNKTKKKVYESFTPIKRIEISESEHILYIIEENTIEQVERLVLLNIPLEKIYKPTFSNICKGDYIAIKEMNGDGNFLINLQRKVSRNKNIEIWYGNDGELGNHQNGFDSFDKYWIIENYTQTSIVENPDSKKIFSQGNSNYLLAFKKGKLQNYTSLMQDIDLYTYDLKAKTYEHFDIVKNSILYLSKMGEYCIYRNLEDKWVVAEMSSLNKIILPNGDLLNPVFTEDASKIYFESIKGLFIYDIMKQALLELPKVNGQKIQILNKRTTPLLTSNYRVYKSFVSKDVKIIIKTEDIEENLLSYYSMKNLMLSPIIKSTKNFVRDFYFTNGANKFCFTLENYNMPMTLNYFDATTNRRHPLLTTDNKDASVKNLKNEVITYFSAEKKKLKGILYYPTNFNTQKKYPLIVRLYQIQSNTRNQYNILGYNNPVSFDLRALLDSGYFVLLPDIVFSSKGTGLSALDCVNKALDAIQYRSYIDKGKIGLTGHSHGGYETNFIATHSNRFAAYLSGAGNSDIVRSYFSYNYNFRSPFYWQYEDGQYEIKIPFSENKKLYFDNNPIYNVEKINAPILLWAGKLDENIKWDQVMEFYIGLKRNKKDVVALFYTNQGHNPDFNSEERRDLYYRTLDWWDYFLKDKKDIDWINKQIKKDAL